MKNSKKKCFGACQSKKKASAPSKSSTAANMDKSFRKISVNEYNKVKHAYKKDVCKLVPSRLDPEF